MLMPIGAQIPMEKDHSLFCLCGRVISWPTKRQPIVTVPSTEAEYLHKSLFS